MRIIKLIKNIFYLWNSKEKLKQKIVEIGL
jgi:hypothetical protein